MGAGGHRARRPAGRRRATGRRWKRAVAQAAALDSGLLIDGSAVLPGISLLVRLITEVLEFDVEMVGIEELPEAKERGAGLVVAAGIDEGADLAMPAPGETDEAAGMGAK